MTARPLAALVIAALAACGRIDCTPAPGPVRPNVVLVTIDTLRADHLGCYGNDVVRTPSLDRLGAEGVVFERCYSQTHVTVPSHLTIMSSLPLAAHGVRQNDAVPPRAVAMLPDGFAGAGYRTAAFVSAQHLGPKGPLGPLLRSFEVFEAPRRKSVPATADETNRQVFRWLRRTCREPLFAWVHYYDPHMPYSPPPPYNRAYYDGDPYDARQTSMDAVELEWLYYDLDDVRHRLRRRATDVRALKRELHVRTRQVSHLVFNPNEVAAMVDAPAARARIRERLHDIGVSLRVGLPLRRPLADWLTGVRDVRYPLAEYAGEVSYVDEAVGRLREEIDRLNLAGRTIVVLTADHGESLGEHGVWFDHVGLHEPNIRVPLIVWAPGRLAPARRPERARGLDVAPTVLRLAGLPVPAAMQGRDLFAAADGGEPVIAEMSRGRQVMALAGRWKLIRTLQTFYHDDAFEREAGAVELYDLDDDPGERENVVARHADVAAALGATLDGWLAAQAAPDGAATGPAKLGPDMERTLRALGYVQ